MHLAVHALTGEMLTLNNQPLPEITLEEVNGYENNSTTLDNVLKNYSIAIYLGIEDAVAASTETMEIPLSGLVKIATDLEGVFADFKLSSNDLRKELGDYLTSTPFSVCQSICLELPMNCSI